jgi:arrestin-related trafficking adapter 3/6
MVECVDYYNKSGIRVWRDSLRDTRLLCLLCPSARDPILPLAASFKESPLYTKITLDDSSKAVDLNGSGPWTFHHDLKLPPCSQLYFSNNTSACHVRIKHALKFLLKVQRGDEDSAVPETGKPTLYNIVVEKPVNILSVSSSNFLNPIALGN